MTFRRLIDGGRDMGGRQIAHRTDQRRPGRLRRPVRGAAPVWLATIVRCDREEEVTALTRTLLRSKFAPVSRGRSSCPISTSAVWDRIRSGKRRIIFRQRGQTEPDQIAAAEAQRSGGRGHGQQGRLCEYVYELTVRREDSQPLWRVRKDCDAALAAGNRCSLSDRWVVELEAETGKIVSQEHLND